MNDDMDLWLPSSDDESNELRRVRSKLAAAAEKEKQDENEKNGSSNSNKTDALLDWNDSSSDNEDSNNGQQSRHFVEKENGNKENISRSSAATKKDTSHHPTARKRLVKMSVTNTQPQPKKQQNHHQRTDSSSSLSSSSSSMSSVDKLFAMAAKQDEKLMMQAAVEQAEEEEQQQQQQQQQALASSRRRNNSSSSLSSMESKNNAYHPSSRPARRGTFWSPPDKNNNNNKNKDDDDIMSCSSGSSLSSLESVAKTKKKKNSNKNNLNNPYAKKQGADKRNNNNNASNRSKKQPSPASLSSSTGSSFFSSPSPLPPQNTTTARRPNHGGAAVAACRNPYASAGKKTGEASEEGVVAHNPYAKKATATTVTTTTTTTNSHNKGGDGGEKAAIASSTTSPHAPPSVTNNNPATSSSSKYFASSSSVSPSATLPSSQPVKSDKSLKKPSSSFVDTPHQNVTASTGNDDADDDYMLQDELMAQEMMGQQTDTEATAAPSNENKSGMTSQAEQEEQDNEWLQKIIDEEIQYAAAASGSANALNEQQQQQQGSDDMVMENDDGAAIDEAFGFTNSSTSTLGRSNRDYNANDTTIGDEQDDESNGNNNRDGIDTDERVPEVHPSLYVPPPYQEQPEPMVHFFNKRNRPMESRQQVSVTQLFEPRIATLWNKGKFDTFNHLQTEVSNTLAHSDDNVVVSAPTGAGKTAVFEMAMARFFAIDLQASSSSGSNNHNNNPIITKKRKVVYIAPSKALVEERYDDWSTRLSAMRLGIEIVVVTGDGDPGESFRDIMSAHVILTTPEKWDSVTRRWTDNFFLFASVKLLLLDEVHLLADASRGCCLESVVCRIKSIQQAARQIQTTQADVDVSSYSNTSPEAINAVLRIVAVSATLPNIEDIAAFLTANEAHVFDESYRPVPLTTHVVGLGYVGEKSQQQYRFWSGLNREVPPIIHKFSKKRPTIVFCHSKKDTEQLADLLATAHGIALRGSNANSGIACQTRVQRLQRVLIAGMAYHHAGLEADDRRLVERAFSSGKIRVMCATSTLAMGVNLPAHLVVIKGTRAWRGGESGYQELGQASLLQMIGRAGRPGFDTTGTAVIMTDNKSKPLYERMASSGLDPVKSQLLSRLNEVLNAEISQRVISDQGSAINWIKQTLFFIQFNKDPSAYNVQASGAAVDAHVAQLCRDAIRQLRSIGALVQSGDSSIHPRDASHIMSQQLVDFSTMEVIAQLPFDATQNQVLRAMSQIKGLQRPCRRSEKRYLNEAHKSLKYKLDGPPSKVRVQQPWEKAFVLLQASIGQIHLEDYTLRQETTSMVEFASRMLVAAEEFSARASRHGQVVVQTLKLRRSLATGLWCSQNGALGQFSSLGENTVVALRFNGISTFEDVLATSEEAIEKAANRMPPFGLNLRNAVSKVLASTLKLKAEIEYAAGSTTTPSAVVCHLTARDDIPNLAKDLGGSTNTPQVSYTLIAYTDRPGGCLMYKKNVSKAGTYKVVCPPRFGRVSVHLIASMVGLDEKVDLPGNSEMAPSSFAATGKGKTRKIRASNKNASDISTFGGGGVRDPRIRRDKKATGRKAASSTLRQSVMSTKKAAPKTAKKVNVTPSPKPAPSVTVPAATNQPVAHAANETQHEDNRVSGSDCLLQAQRQEPVPLPHKWRQQNHIATGHENTNVMTQSPMRHSQGRVDPRQCAAFSQPNQSYRQPNQSRQESLVQPNQSSKSLFQPSQSSQSLFQPSQSSQSLFQPSQSSQSLFPPTQPKFRQPSNPSSRQAHITPKHTPPPSRPWGSNSGSNEASWSKKEKRAQQSSQRRAFASQRENPFGMYKHDPNNSESMLDAMASRSRNRSSSMDDDSIIPAHERAALNNAYQNTPNFGASSFRQQLQQQISGNKRGRSKSQQQQQARRRFMPSGRQSAMDVLRQKADEQTALDHDSLRQEELYHQQSNSGYAADDYFPYPPNVEGQWGEGGTPAFSQTSMMHPLQTQKAYSMYDMGAATHQQHQQYGHPSGYTAYSQEQEQFLQEPFGGQAADHLDLMSTQQPYGQPQPQEDQQYHQQQSYPSVSAPVSQETLGLAPPLHSFPQGSSDATIHHHQQQPFVSQSSQQPTLRQQNFGSSWDNTEGFEEAFF